MIADQGWEWEGSFVCECGAWCVEWQNHDTHQWRVRHGDGEAIFVIDFVSLIESFGEKLSHWQRWLATVHDYERGTTSTETPQDAATHARSRQ